MTHAAHAPAAAAAPARKARGSMRTSSKIVAGEATRSFGSERPVSVTYCERPRTFAHALACALSAAYARADARADADSRQTFNYMLLRDVHGADVRRDAGRRAAGCALAEEPPQQPQRQLCRAGPTARRDR